ncbi:hypothetical protein NG791_14025 [Laspinema sp. D1]|nr:hypothetical protein [Laspinema sp. D2b]
MLLFLPGILPSGSIWTLKLRQMLYRKRLQLGLDVASAGNWIGSKLLA